MPRLQALELDARQRDAAWSAATMFAAVEIGSTGHEQVQLFCQRQISSCVLYRLRRMKRFDRIETRLREAANPLIVLDEQRMREGDESASANTSPGDAPPRGMNAGQPRASQRSNACPTDDT